MNKNLCEQCKSYYKKDCLKFHGGDYAICEKCGRLLTSFDRENSLSVREKSTPRILLIGDNAEEMWSVRHALFDPRAYVSSEDSTEIIFGAGGTRTVYSATGEVAKFYNLLYSDPEDRLAFNWMVKVKPTITILLLDCVRIIDISDTIQFLINLRTVMYLTCEYEIPTVVALCNADKVYPSWIKEVDKYPSEKKKRIDSLVDQYKTTFRKSGYDVEEIFPLSTYMTWNVKPTVDITKGIRTEDLICEVDGRLNIDKLRRYIGASVEIANSKGVDLL